MADTPMPGPNEFSADEERRMRQAQRQSNVSATITPKGQVALAGATGQFTVTPKGQAALAGEASPMML
jgi:hypothetical protein